MIFGSQPGFKRTREEIEAIRQKAKQFSLQSGIKMNEPGDDYKGVFPRAMRLVVVVVEGQAQSLDVCELELRKGSAW